MNKYIEGQFGMLLPVSNFRPTIQLRSEHGQTNHLGITWDTIDYHLGELK